MDKGNRIYIPPRTPRRESDAFFVLGFGLLGIMVVGAVSATVWFFSR